MEPLNGQAGDKPGRGNKEGLSGSYVDRFLPSSPTLESVSDRVRPLLDLAGLMQKDRQVDRAKTDAFATATQALAG